MTRCVWKATTWIAAVLFIGFALPVAAQTPAPGPEVGVGYQLLHVPGDNSDFGFNVDIAVPRNEVWSIIGELGWSRFEEDVDGNGDLDDASADVLHFGGGARFNWPFTPRVTGYVQAIAGIERAAGEFDTDFAFMLQPGGGVVVSVGDRWGVFVQGDLRPVFFREELDEQSRLVIGARFTLR